MYKKGPKGIAAFLAIGTIIVFVLATIASRGMERYFNEVMARQTMMRSTVTIEKFICYTMGTLTFYRGLLFGRTPEGQVAQCTDGKVRVNMWDNDDTF